jgi:hypothetical protein
VRPLSKAAVHFSTVRAIDLSEFREDCLLRYVLDP